MQGIVQIRRIEATRRPELLVEVFELDVIVSPGFGDESCKLEIDETGAH